MEEFLRTELERPGFSVEAREEDRVERLGGLTLRLRPDRVDRLANGERLIIDYKTGGEFRAANWLGARLREPQLPLYAVLLGADAVAIVELKGAGVSWHGVAAGGAGPTGVKDVAQFGADPHADWPGLLRAWRLAIERIAAEFMQGDFRLDLHDRELAQGRWAMLTRIHELDAAHRVTGQ
jgi:hypothetical protein